MIVIIGVLVLGPKELPTILYQIGKLVRRLQYMRFALSNQFDDFMQQAELQDTAPQTEQLLTTPEDYEKPAPIYALDDEMSPFEKAPFHQVSEQVSEEESYDPDREEDEGYVEEELSFLRNLREEER